MAAAALAACALAGPAAAVTCTVSTSALSFGTYDPYSPAPTDASAAIDVYCTCSGPDCIDFGYQIEIDAGASGSTSDRRLLPSGAGVGTLGYALYQDPAHTTEWATGLDAQGQNYPQALFGSFQRTMVYGRIPPGQHVEADAYGEAPVVTIIY